jgi:hypothetical protein
MLLSHHLSSLNKIEYYEYSRSPLGESFWANEKQAN